MSKKPLIVYFHRYPPEFETIQYPGMKDLFKELSEKNYRIVYLSMKGHQPKDKKLRQEIKVREIPLKVDTTNNFDKWMKTFFYYLFLPRTLAELKALKPDFIICKETLPFVPLIVSKLKIPMIADISDWWWSILLGNKKFGRVFAKEMEKIEVKKWNKSKVIAITHSNAEGKVVESKGMPKNKIKVINAPLYRGVYFPLDAAKERKKIDPEDNSWIVSVHGIIHQSKGYDQLLEWWKKLLNDHPNWKLLIIGGAGGEAWCREKIKQLGIQENVIMTGWLETQEQVNKYLNASDCLLATRRNTEENKGIIPASLYHSLLVGKPTVITGLPGMSEIITHKKDGFIFEPDNFNSFKSVLEEIYNNPVESLKIAKQGIKRGEDCFDPKIAAIKWREVIDESLKAKSI